MDSRSRIRTGSTLGPYRLQRRIERTAIADVWEATLEGPPKRTVTIKIVPPHAVTGAQALEKLKHKNVETVYQIGEQDGVHYVVLAGGDRLPLDHFMMSYPCGLKVLLEIFRQMLEGLAAAHEAGCLHRDLNPSSVIIDPGLTVKLVDFTYVERRALNPAREHARIGALNYLPPEMVVGKSASPQSDIYALGLVLHGLLTGETPFAGRSAEETLEKIRTTALALSPRLQPLLPESLKRLVARMTAKAPNQRYATAREALKDLEQVSLEGLPADLRQVPPVLVPIYNYTEIRKRSESQGFDGGELRFIVNLAARLHLDNEPHTAGQPLRIGEDVLQETFKRFQLAKSTLMNRGTHVLPRRKNRLHELWLPLVTVLALVAFLMYAGSKSPQVTQQPAGLSDADPREPASRENPSDQGNQE